MKAESPTDIESELECAKDWCRCFDVGEGPPDPCPACRLARLVREQQAEIERLTTARPGGWIPPSVAAEIRDCAGLIRRTSRALAVAELADQILNLLAPPPEALR